MAKNQLGVECIMDADETPYTYSPRLRSLRFPRETGYLSRGPFAEQAALTSLPGGSAQVLGSIYY